MAYDSLIEELGGYSDKMNLFYLDHDPALAARMHCDKHVVKMILETAQLLSTAWHVAAPAAVTTDIGSRDPLNPDKFGSPGIELGFGMTYYLSGNQRIYAATHPHHPSAVWVRACVANYDWAWRLGMHLLDEYTHRYRKQHGCTHVLRALEFPPPIDATTPQYEPPPAMPEECYVLEGRFLDAVASYRNYYRMEKKRMLVYTKRRPPEWCADIATWKAGAPD